MQTMKEKLQKANERIAELETENSSKFVKYTFSASTGWKRIARLYSKYNGSYSRIIIMNQSPYGSVLELKAAHILGYGKSLTEELYNYTNAKLFTKARLVYKTSSDLVYLEVYQDLEYEKGAIIFRDDATGCATLMTDETERRSTRRLFYIRNRFII